VSSRGYGGGVTTLTRRADSRREQIEQDVLRATEALLAGGASYAELNIERIAKAAGISRTAFYFYFRDKRDLLIRLTEDVAAQLYEQADGWWHGEGDGREELRVSLAAIFALYTEHDVLLRAVVETSAYDEPVAEAWRAIVTRFVDATRNRIESEQRAGDAARGIPAATTAFALVWMVERACYQRLVQGGALDDPEFVEGLTGIFRRTVYGD
jgi:TetR/AcrR family transcriptional regulator, ethionamide resistance regulator